MKISIIIPIYNVSAYIGRCLESVFSQDYADWEAILVDDCGHDDSMEIARTLVAERSLSDRFIFFKHENNRGLSAARNTGILAASGEYLYFLDSDDYITPDALSKLAGPIKQKKADLVVGNFSVEGDSRGIPRLYLNSGFVHPNEVILRLYTQNAFYMMAWNKLVAKDFLLKHKLFFEEGLIHEDDLWSFELACFASLLAVVRSETYVYVIRANSIQTTRKAKEEIERRYKVIYLMNEFAEKNKFYQNELVLHFLERIKADFIGDASAVFSFSENFRLYCRVRKLFHKGFLDLKNRKWWLRDVHYALPPFIGYLYLKLFLLFDGCRKKFNNAK